MADESLPRLTQDEKTALTPLLKRTIDAGHYPLAKLQPPKPASSPLVNALRAAVGLAIAGTAANRCGSQINDGSKSDVDLR